MKLYLKQIVKEEKGRLDYVIASYYGDDGYEYRKSFLSYGRPIVPEQGTHKELNTLQKQY